MQIMKVRYKNLDQWMREDLKKRFIDEYETGMITITKFSKTHNVHRSIVTAWKIEEFGYINQREKLIFQMVESGLKFSMIALFFGIAISSVKRSYKKHKISLKIT